MAKKPKLKQPPIDPAERQRIREEDAGTIKQREVRADTLYRDLKEELKNYFETRQQLIDGFKRDLEERCPELAVSTSRDSCLVAVRTLENHYHELVEQNEIPRKELQAKSAELALRRANLAAIYLRLSEKRLSSGRTMGFVSRYSELLWNAPNQMKEFELVEKEAAGSRDPVVLQLQMHSMMEGQSQEARDWVLVQNNAFSEHLAKTVNSKPFVSLGVTRKLGQNTNGNIPPEIVAMIYSFCDLETAVVLREVNHCFYTSFGHNETIFETKVQARFPWALLEDEIPSWSDFALVYMKRLSGGKWKFETEMNNLRPERQEIQIKTLICQQLEPEQDLGDTFQRFESFRVGPNSPSEHITVVSHTEEELVIECQDVRLTLPPDYDPAALTVTVNRDHTTVLSGRFPDNHIFQREQPRHVDHALTYSSDNLAWTILEIYGIKGLHRLNHSYAFYDRRSRTIHRLKPARSAHPVASYNGLIWWYMKPSSIVPTFFDMATPERIYQRPDKIAWTNNFTGLAQHIGNVYNYSQYGREPHGGNRFVNVRSKLGMTVVDLSTSTVTEIQPFGGMGNVQDEEGEFLVGFSNGKFDVRYKG